MVSLYHFAHFSPPSLGSIAALAEWSGWIIGLLFFVGYGIGWIISALLERKIKRLFYSKFVGDAIG